MNHGAGIDRSAGGNPSDHAGVLDRGVLHLELPFTGTWFARNSPARRVPSHGTHVLGLTYAIDFVACDASGLPAPRTWRTALSVEPPEVFRGFGAPILAPVAGRVHSVHDGEPDHEARRSQLALVPYALTQRRRARAGIAGLTGNHVVVAVGPAGPFVLLAHLRRGSVRVTPGQSVQAGDQLAECGNSGNSTQPHVHVQATTSTDWWSTVRGVPIDFRHPAHRTRWWIPQESEVFDVPDTRRWTSVPGGQGLPDGHPALGL